MLVQFRTISNTTGGRSLELTSSLLTKAWRYFKLHYETFLPPCFVFIMHQHPTVQHCANLVSGVNSVLIGNSSHSFVSLTTGPETLPERVPHRVRSSASFFNFLYPLLFLKLSSSFLYLLLRLPFTSIFPLHFLR
jgi:hypothetical protein